MLEKAEKLCSSSGDEYSKAMIKYEMGNLYDKMAEFYSSDTKKANPLLEKSLKYYGEALSFYSKANKLELIEVYIGLGDAYSLRYRLSRSLSDKEKALKMYNKAMEVMKKHKVRYRLDEVRPKRKKLLDSK